MKLRSSKWMITAFLTCAAMAAQAQLLVQPSGAKITQAEAVRNQAGTLAQVRMQIDLTAVRMSSNESLVLTPTLVSADGQTHALPSVVVEGRKRNIINLRRAKHGAVQVVDTTLRRYSHEQQQVAYEAEVPYAVWMRGANVVVREEVRGCADCPVRVSDGLATPLLAGVFGGVPITPVQPIVTPPVVKQPVAKPWLIASMTPKAELRKERSEKFEATFTYRVNRTELVRSFEDNARKLDEVDEVIKTIKAKPTAKVSYVDIAGYASPEGNAANNMRLSRGRAEAFEQYLMDKHGLSRSQMRVNWYGSDWDGLLAVLDRGEVINPEDAKHIANIIRTGRRDDAMRMEIINYKFSVPYMILLNVVYPKLRRNEYTVSYTVDAFDLETARRVIWTNPELLSLHEMYTVAASYAVGSAEHKHALETAYTFFPNAPESRVNRSEALINAGQYAEALRLLEGVDVAEAKNNIGVCYAKQGHVEEAHRYFSQAAQAGSATAVANLKLLLH